MTSVLQFRMDTSERVDAYLPTTTKPVIEKCIGINFSVHPASPPVGADEPTNVRYRVPWETFARLA